MTAMDLSEFINTRNYLHRIYCLLDSQRDVLSEKQYAQFAQSFDREIQDLKKKLAEYDENLVPTTVPASRHCNFAYRLVHAFFSPRPAYAQFCLAQSVHSDIQVPFEESNRYLYQDSWQTPSGSCEVANLNSIG